MMMFKVSVLLYFVFKTKKKLCKLSSNKLDQNPVIIEKDEAFKIMSIGINRPNKRNCVNKATADLLFDAFNEFNEDDEYHVAVLHGIGGNFCAGNFLYYNFFFKICM